MLKVYIDDITKHIESINVEDAQKSLFELTLENNRVHCERIAGNLTSQNKERVIISPEFVAKGLAMIQVHAIKLLPVLCSSIYDFINKNHCEPVHKMCLASVLIYLAQPNDFIPDNTINGLGYLDDALIAFTISNEYFTMLFPDENKEVGQQNFDTLCNALALAVPISIYSLINNRIKEIWESYHTLKNMNPEMAEMIFQETINNPHTLTEYIKINLNKTQNIPEPPKIQPGYNLSNNIFYDNQSESLHVSFPMGGGAISTPENIVIWD